MGKIIVIGAGASGMMAAIAAARAGASVTVLEQMEKPGKKLLTTGNGRCNLTNTKPPEADTYRGANKELVHPVLCQFPAEDTLAFFHELGLLTRERDGYVYPYTEQAGTVLEILLQEIRRLKIKMKYCEKVTEIQRTGEGFLVSTATWNYACDRVILCAGGKAAPQTGSDGSGYLLSEKCGHRINPVYPALVPLKTGGKMASALSGIRNPAVLSLEIDGNMTHRESGELQWTEYGVSGIVVFQLSRYASAALAEKRKVRLHIDLMPDYTAEEIEALFREKSKRNPEQNAEELLTGFLKKKMIGAFLKILGKKPLAQGMQNFCRRVVPMIKDLTLDITGTKTFDMAQVCMGGVSLEEVTPQTLQSKIEPGLYFAGELLDVDAICGGYNLQWAWASGYVAGSNAGRDRI